MWDVELSASHAGCKGCEFQDRFFGFVEIAESSHLLCHLTLPGTPQCTCSL